MYGCVVYVCVGGGGAIVLRHPEAMIIVRAAISRSDLVGQLQKEFVHAQEQKKKINQKRKLDVITFFFFFDNHNPILLQWLFPNVNVIL